MTVAALGTVVLVDTSRNRCTADHTVPIDMYPFHHKTIHWHSLYLSDTANVLHCYRAIHFLVSVEVYSFQLVIVYFSSRTGASKNNMIRHLWMSLWMGLILDLTG